MEKHLSSLLTDEQLRDKAVARKQVSDNVLEDVYSMLMLSSQKKREN